MPDLATGSHARPLRVTLERLDPPRPIEHGSSDRMRSVAAAHAHARPAPQGRLERTGAEGALLDEPGERLARWIAAVLASVDPGDAARHPDGSGARSSFALTPTPAAGSSLLLAMAAIAAATLVSEDLTCVGVGVLVARSRIDFLPAVLACLTGIVLGDLLLFAAGRTLGRAALERRPLRHLVSPVALQRSSAWLQRHGMSVVLLSRLAPGTRLPTYFAAGALRTRGVAFATFFVLAAALWTPAVVALAAWAAGYTARPTGGPAGWLAMASLVALALVLRTLPPLLTWRGRRLAIGRWRRLRGWEFWPLPIVYLPIVAQVIRLALRHRSFTLATAVNPGIPGGGCAGESKFDILRRLGDDPAGSLAATRIPGTLPPGDRAALGECFVTSADLSYPVVVKPDVGERGSGVLFPRDHDELARALARSGGDWIVQEYAGGFEFGIFYYRRPDEARGRIFSITEKILPAIRGDGRHTVEALVLSDERAVCLAERYLAPLADRLDEVLPRAVELPLVQVGTHSRGAIFRDGMRLWTPELEAEIDRIAHRFRGFHFGRFDLRVPTLADLQAGRRLRILELNGLTAEATHVYDPAVGIREAYRTLFEQWAIAFEIARLNRDRGARPTPLRELWSLLRRRRAVQRALAAA